MIVYAADDESLMLYALTDAIHEALPKAQIKGFRRGGELLKAVEEEPCHIAFLDIYMPVMDGMTVARKIITMKKDVNIIFATGYDQYKAEAMDIYASGYLLKPITPEKVIEAVQHLRYPIPEMNRRFRAFTFGNFSLYVDGKPVTFHRKKSAELLAYLVAKEGTVVSRPELTLALFEDETHSQRSRKNLDNAIRTLRDDLAKVNAEEILYIGSDGLAVNREILDADLFDYMRGGNQTFPGMFLEQYSWSEYFKWRFEKN